MQEANNNLPAVAEQATALVRKYEQQGMMVFVQPEDLNTQSLFIPEVVVVEGGPEDFHSISGSMMPKSYQTDKIGEAAGISFISEHCGTRKEGDHTWVGFAQGRKRLPDGTQRNSHKHEYEYDVDVRSEEDFLNDTKGK